MSEQQENAGQFAVKFEGDLTFREPIIAALKSIYDPEIPVDIYELGLIYGVNIKEDKSVRVEMTLTSPSCPSAEVIPVEVKEKILMVEGIDHCNVDIVWDPTWTPEFMSDVAKVSLNMF